MKKQASVVVPVYNAEKYLEQCIQSIVNQDIGFEQIELVLVNDGSSDSSGKICEKYANKYPDNVVYINKKNAGVSEARNTGLRKATGSYIGFVDADDYLSLNAVGSVLKYFNEEKSPADVAIIRVIQIGYYIIERSINNKFYQGTRTIDLRQPEWYDVNPRVSPSFIKASVAKKHTFDKSITIYEDTRYITEATLKTMKLGVVSAGVYFNRIHYGDVNASITTGATKDKRLYLDSPEKVSLHLLREFKGGSEYPPLYIQYVALYEMRWRMFYNPHNPRELLSESEFSLYEKVNKDMLKLISDEAIVNYMLYSIDQRMFLLNLKHGNNFMEKAHLNNNCELVWEGNTILNYKDELTAKITDAFYNKDEIILEGYISLPMVKGFRLDLYRDGEITDEVVLDVKSNTSYASKELNMKQGERYGESFTARITIDFSTAHTYDFVLASEDMEFIFKKASLTKLQRYGFKYKGNYKIAPKIGGIIVAPLTSHLLIRRAVTFMRYLIKLGLRVARRIQELCIQMIKTLR